MPKKRDYKKQAAYNRRPSVQAKRVRNNKLRRQAIREGKAKVGDGTHVDHKKPMSRGGSDKKSNLRIVSGKKNMSFARRSDKKPKLRSSKKKGK